MAANSKYRGHNIIYKNDRWLYANNGESTIGNERPCGHCRKVRTKEGHDYCLGLLSNVMNACCGHGVEDKTYVQFWNKDIIRNKKAIEWIKRNVKTKRSGK
ncbi:hypothetical protein LCGC14_0570460 [marine sediment metagenome]|uniref:Uncharacterized protein n=1 Tax=marine sediment metagenome TaxID=412755 RepID=A0A0F9RPI8_9ZZZZ|nr:hypothetical protein [Pricia sp.]